MREFRATPDRATPDGATLDDVSWLGAALERPVDAIPRRADTPGTRLNILVLAVDADHVAGVDLASGALVRAWTPTVGARRLAHRGGEGRLHPYEVVTGTLAVDDDRVPDPTQPEAVMLVGAPERIGRLKGRRAERYLRPLVHPPGEPLLGSHGPTVPFWERRADHPSIALVEPEAAAVVYRRGDRLTDRLTCRFRWRGRPVDMPFLDPWVTDLMQRRGCYRLASQWGQRLVVALTPPIGGHCHKVVTTLLKRP